MIISKASALGRRQYQEDRVSVISNEETGTFISVFDGHGGSSVSEEASTVVPTIWYNLSTSPEWQNTTLEQRLDSTITIMEHLFRNSMVGSTVSLAFIPPEKNIVYCAILGDSPILVGNSNTGQVHISPEHNVDTHEIDRNELVSRGVVVANGYQFNEERNGLQLTRCLGDKPFENQLSTVPEIYSVSLTENSWVLAGTDGLFSGHNTEAKNPIIALTNNPNNNAWALVNAAVNFPTRDNVSAVLVRMSN